VNQFGTGLATWEEARGFGRPLETLRGAVHSLAKSIEELRLELFFLGNFFGHDISGPEGQQGPGKIDEIPRHVGGVVDPVIGKAILLDGVKKGKQIP
jgi:hypothetical protein